MSPNHLLLEPSMLAVSAVHIIIYARRGLAYVNRKHIYMPAAVRELKTAA